MLSMLPPGVRACVHLAAKQQGHRPMDLLAPTRLRADVADARMVAMALARRVLNLPYQVIGFQFGRDHTTVLHACRSVEERGDLGARVVALEDHIKNECARDEEFRRLFDEARRDAGRAQAKERRNGEEIGGDGVGHARVVGRRRAEVAR